MTYEPCRITSSVHALRFARTPASMPGSASHDAQVWLCNMHDSAERLTRFETSLSADELERASRFRFQEDRLRFVTGRGLARELVGSAIGVEPALVPIAADMHGRPVVLTARDMEPVTFSVSHAGDLVLVALSRDCEIGVDVERERADLPLLELAVTAFASGEHAALAALPDVELRAAFFALWTRREALTKALGRGLKLPAESVQVSASLIDVPRVMRLPDGHGAEGEWTLRDLCLPDGYSGALAVRARNGRRVRLGAWRLP